VSMEVNETSAGLPRVSIDFIEAHSQTQSTGAAHKQRFDQGSDKQVFAGAGAGDSSPNCVATILDEPSRLDLGGDPPVSPVSSPMHNSLVGGPVPMGTSSRGLRKGTALAHLTKGTTNPISQLHLTLIVLIAIAGLGVPLLGLYVHRQTQDAITSISRPEVLDSTPAGRALMPGRGWIWPMVLSPKAAALGHLAVPPKKPSKNMSKKVASGVDRALAEMDFADVGLLTTQPWLAWHVHDGLAAEQPEELRFVEPAISEPAFAEAFAETAKASSWLPAWFHEESEWFVTPGPASPGMSVALALACIPWGAHIDMPFA